MIIGKGMIANAFKSFSNSQSIIIFASGVSNSQETSDQAFLREQNLLIDTLQNNKDATIVYFSTCSIYDSSIRNNHYIKHKVKMEEYVKQHNHYYIFRLPQVVGRTNSPTLINTITNKIINKEMFELWSKSSRNLIAARDVHRIASLILEKRIFCNSTHNLAAPRSHSMIKIVNTIEEILNQKAVYNKRAKWVDYAIDTPILVQVLNTTDILFQNSYIKNTLKYYLKYDINNND
jgi:nucleoside-diphosphate-sugar epimerase